jgi:hypothetical protein
MLRFSIREILLLTVVVALAFGWWMHAHRMREEVLRLQAQCATKSYERVFALWLKGNNPDVTFGSDGLTERKRSGN